MSIRKFTIEGTINMEDGTVTPTPTPTPTPSPSGSLEDRFDGSDGLITNEWAYWSGADPRAVKSANWEMSSGSMFRKAGQMWTGIPDDKYVGTDPLSATWNHSAIFRATTKRKDFKNVSVAFRLNNLGYTQTASTPPVAWDGVHVFLRFQSEFSLYYASVNRRDNTIMIKKKIPGGPSNQGTYWNGKIQPFPAPLNTWTNYACTAKDNGPNVDFAIYANGSLIFTDTDDGKTWKSAVVGAVQGPPLQVAGAVGFRIDNSQCLADDFVVNAI